jgi:heme-degrading monooxygenase HmoA
MAILAMAEIPGATHEMYDRVNELMGITADNPPAGLIHHLGLDTDDGMMIIDVWESADAFKSFIDSNMDKMQAAGIPPFEPTILPVHNMLLGSGTQPNVAIIIDMPGLTADQYDDMTAQMSAHAGDGSSHPSVSHTAATGDDGLVVVDVWDSPESFGRFAETEIAAAGDLGDVQPRILPVYNRLAGRTRVSA